MTTPSNDTLAAQLASLQEDIAELKGMLREAMSSGVTDRHQLNVRVARLEEQAKVVRWLLGAIGTATIGMAVAMVAQRLFAVG